MQFIVQYTRGFKCYIHQWERPVCGLSVHIFHNPVHPPFRSTLSNSPSHCSQSFYVLSNRVCDLFPAATSLPPSLPVLSGPLSATNPCLFHSLTQWGHVLPKLNSLPPPLQSKKYAFPLGFYFVTLQPACARTITSPSPRWPFACLRRRR